MPARDPAAYARKWRTKHKVRLQAYNQEYYRRPLAVDPATPVWRKKYLSSKFGITVGEYNKLLQVQNGACGICGTKPKTRRLSVDHDHKSGQIRGLLCPRCNRGLAWFSDNSARLEKAACYLRHSLSAIAACA